MKSRFTNVPKQGVFLLLILFFCSNPWKLHAQNTKTITGTVYDSSSHEHLPGVSIHIKGSTSGTTTGPEGGYSIKANDRDILVFSFIGYESQQFTVNKQTEINVALSKNATQLSEVVAIGYGTQTKATVTGSVTSVQGDVVNRSPNINLASSLQGMLPGTMALQSTGEPGRSDPTIHVRGLSTTGNTSPLVVVDGVPNAPGWQYINSNDIASISVLKDASAAIYGARAANGVILITTKRGGLGKPAISYTFNQGFTRPAMTPTPASSYEFSQYVNQLAEESGASPVFSKEEIEKFRTGDDPENYPNINWYHEMLKRVTPQSQHNLNVRGGNEDVKYSLSGSYSNQNSLFKDGSLNFKTYAIRSNLDAHINKNIKLGLDINAGINDGDYPSYNVSSTMQGILQQLPWRPVYWANGLPSPGIERGENPAMEVSSASGNNGKKNKRFTGKASLDITVPWVTGLSISGFFSFFESNNVNKNWKTPWTVYDRDTTNGNITYIPHQGGGVLAPELTQSYSTGRDKLLNLRVSYNRIFGEHSLKAFLAGEQEEGVSSNFSAFRRDFISSEIDELFAGSLDNQKTNGSKSESGRQSLFGRISYGYRGKYLIDINFRYDGSSNFPKDERFGFFPGTSIAWRISEESFMEDINYINNLKLRASYGQIGNDRITPFQYLTLYSLSGGYLFGNPESYQLGLDPRVTPNPNVTWETAELTNVGVDATLWNGLFDFTLDIFKQKRSNILTTRHASIPAFTNLSLPSENIGVVENKGLEVQVSTSNKIGQLNYKIGANFSYHKSEIIDIDEPSNIPKWQSAEGHVIGATTYYQALGIFRTQEEVKKKPVFPGTKVGDLQYRDVNGDGEISANDMVISDKTNIPKITYGFNFSLKYGSFSLWANFAGYGDVWQYYHLNARNAMNTVKYLIQNRYTPGSMDSKLPILPTIEGSVAGEPSGLKSDFWLFNTSYLRLKTVEIGYSFPPDFLSKIRVKGARVYINGNNLLTFSRFKLFDPANTQNKGYYYPVMANLNIGFNINF